MGKIAIYGFGRIGRSMLKTALKRNLFTPVAIADIRDLATFASLFEVDKQLWAMARGGHYVGHWLCDRWS